MFTINRTIRAFLKRTNLIPDKSRVGVGLSGGPDSVFLLHMLAAERQRGTVGTLIAAHLDHEWRTNSNRDVAFCRDIAKKYGARFVSRKISELSISLKFNGSKEDVGRQARRFFFEQVRTQHNADLIALGHHAQDQEETFFIRLIRGATLSGLTGMKPKHGVYIRPLLTTKKQEIIQYLDAHNIPYLIDPSNSSQEFLRNRIRANVLPALRQCDTRFGKKFEHAVSSLQETDDYLAVVTDQTFFEITCKENGVRSIDTTRLIQLHPALQKRVLLFWMCQENVQFPVSERFFSEIIRFLNQPRGGTHQLCADWRIVKKLGQAWIEK